jgi:hypothetical protein
MISEPWLGCWAELIGVGGVAYDIGANAGEWTRWLKERFASVVSLEPDDRCEPPAGCRYDQRAVWHTTGAGVLYRREMALQSSLSSVHELPDFIKIDIEGAEAEAIASATLPCFRQCRWLVELHNTRDAVVEQFERLGYENCEIIKHPSPHAAAGHEWMLVTP